MAEITIEEVRQFLQPLQGKEVQLEKLRTELQIDKGSKSWDGIRRIMFRLTEQKIIKASGKRDGTFKVLYQIEPVKVFGGKNDNEVFELMFPRDFETGMEFPFADYVVIRPGDLILIAGVSNYGKTALSMNFLAENIGKHRCVLLGNEFTTSNKKPTPRLLKRLETMDWVEWTDEAGADQFTLLPVHEDFEEYVVAGALNIIDWINIETGEYYMINNILQKIKLASGSGISIAVIQKSENAEAGRGGQFTKDFADLELIIDKHDEFESRLTIGKVKETKKPITGKSWAYEISNGVQIKNVREVVKCPRCFGKKWHKAGNASIPCEVCYKIGWVNK